MSVIAELEKFHKDYIIKSYQDGKSSVVLSKEFNCDPAYFTRLLKKWGISVKKVKYFEGEVSDRHEDIMRMYGEGFSVKKIGRELKIGETAIGEYLNKIGIDTSRYYTKKNPENLLKPKTEQVIQLFKEGYNCNEISKIVGNARRNIAILLNENGYETDIPEYKIDKNFFKLIDNEAKAYALGFITADGCISSDFKRIAIKIQEEDLNILEKIKKSMKYEGPILRIKRGKNAGNRKNMVALVINRGDIAKDITNLGCGPRKSLVVEFPNIEIVPQHLVHHYTRGVWDGDGTISKYYCSMAGGYNFELELQKRLQNIGISTKVYKKTKYKDLPNKNCCHDLQIHHKDNYIPFIKWLYKDATIFLNRKASKALEIVPDLGITLDEPKTEVFRPSPTETCTI